MRRLVPLIALLALACGDETPPARSQATSGAEQGRGSSAAGGTRGKPPPLPAPFEGTFTMSLRVPLRAIAEQIDAQLPTHEATEKERLTSEGHSPEIEASYEIWRDPVTVRYADKALQVDVPLRFAARFDARVKSPFGGWLRVAKDEPWGTPDDPQRVTLRVRTKVKISAGWELRLQSRVEPPEHGPPPPGKLCTGGSFKLCVSKESVAPEVRRRIDAEVVPRMEQALGELDLRLQGAVALRSRLELAWQLLAQPRRFDAHGRWVVIEPRKAALTLRSGDDDAVIVEPAVFARVSYSEGRPQAPPPPPLPDKVKPSELPGPRVQLPAALAPAELEQLLPRL